MKKIVLLALMVLPLIAGAQTKIKETAVPRSVLLALEKTYDSYKVRTWYQAPGQYIAELVIDGQNGRAYFTAGGDWQYSAFPVKMEECPTLLTAYFTDNYPGYRVKTLDYIEEMNGDNYYRLITTKKGISDKDFEMVFDTRGKLMKSNAPDPASVKRDYYTHNNPDATDEQLNKATKTSSSRHANRPKPRTDAPPPWSSSSLPARLPSPTSRRASARSAARADPTGSTATTSMPWPTSPTSRKSRKKPSTTSTPDAPSWSARSSPKTATTTAS